MFTSNELKPGVSAINPSPTFNNSTSLVVCFPLPRDNDTSPVFNERDESILLSKLDFPLPVCPHKATTLFLNSFLFY